MDVQRPARGPQTQCIAFGDPGAIAIAIATAIALTAIPCGTALAAIESQSPAATLQLPGEGAALTVSGGDFSLLAWIRPAAVPGPGSPPRKNIITIEGALEIHLLDGGAIAAAVHDETRLATTTTAQTGAAINPGEWALLAVSFNSAGGSLDVWARSESQSLQHAAAPAAAGMYAGPAGDVLVGATPAHGAMIGLYGLIAIRDHPLTAQDIDAVWSAQRHPGPYVLVASPSGGLLNGTAGCRWMIGHAVSTRPINLSGAASTAQSAAVIGQPLTQYNVHVYDATAPSHPTELNAVRPAMLAEGFIVRSPHDPPADGFFIRGLPVASTLPPWTMVEHVSPRLRQLATGPKGLLRVMTSANSRATQPDDGTIEGSGNYAHGFTGINAAQTAGVINRPARLEKTPWFGFDASHDAPHASGQISNLISKDFSRFWTGAVNGNSIGPGEGLLLSPDAVYALRCRPQGLIEAPQPLLVQAHLLRYPGASAVHWSPNKHTQQGQAGSDASSPMAIPLDTTILTHTFTPAAGDFVVSPTRIILAGDLTSSVAVADACYVKGAISLVAEISFDPATQTTTIDFEHPLSSTPLSGDVLRFGDWGIETIEHLWPGLQPTDPAVWRGLRLIADNAGEGVVVFGYSAWRPEVDGYVFGVAGWGGRGYTPQIDQSFAAAMPAWLQALAPDVWLQMFAQQLSLPQSMADYAAIIRDALPDVEIAWLGDMPHEVGGAQEAWHYYILTAAAENDVVAVSVLNDPSLGNQIELWGDGLRSDANHISQRGNERLASLWTDALLEAALDGPGGAVPGDLTGDGTVGVDDLLILLATWGQCEDPDDCAADLSGDSQVGVDDLLILLANWG